MLERSSAPFGVELIIQMMSTDKMYRTLADIEGRYVVVPPGEGVSLAEIHNVRSPAPDYAVLEDGSRIPRIVVRPWSGEYPDTPANAGGFNSADMRPLAPMPSTASDIAPTGAGLSFGDLISATSTTQNSDIWDVNNNAPQNILSSWYARREPDDTGDLGAPGAPPAEPPASSSGNGRGLGPFADLATVRPSWDPAAAWREVDDATMARPESETPLPEQARDQGEDIFERYSIAQLELMRRIHLVVRAIAEHLLERAKFVGRVAGTYSDGRDPPTEEEMRGWAVGTALDMIRLGRPNAMAGSVGATGGRLRGIPSQSAEGKMGFEKAGAYPPPIKPELPVPPGMRANARGKYTHTMDGVPINEHAFVAGLREVGKPNEGLTPAQMDLVFRRMTGEFPKQKRAEAMPGVIGYFKAGKNGKGDIFTSTALRAATRSQVVPHEIGHTIEEMTKHALSNSKVSARVMNELEQVYSTLNIGREGPPLRRPSFYRYQPIEYMGEYFADALRSYMANPNYFKTVAPETAALIRNVVNNDPTLSKIIQFNTLLPGLGATATQGDGSGTSGARRDDRP